MKTPEECLIETLERKRYEKYGAPTMVSFERAVKAAELYAAQFRTERLTNEQIDAMYNEAKYGIDDAIVFRVVARQVRDLLQGKGRDGV